jgi:hypothetical protein
MDAPKKINYKKDSGLIMVGSTLKFASLQAC